ncbi:hypothetical protein [Acinetobacter variabilis]|uniref:hypothetical protein n=1 Tax=Acinetobacter variabilis TaxID=70346 RepID=UPI00289CDBAF|nr:hypothetical protein [Acinetobacter variabilis]
MNKYLKSIQAEVNLLKSIIDYPNNYENTSEDLLEALKNQNNFSNYENTNLKILKYSLNTHKEYIKLYYNHPFEHIDKLRKNAYSTLKNHFKNNNKAPNIEKKESKKNYKNNINQLLENKSLSHNILLTSIILNLKEKLDFYVKKINDLEITKDYESMMNEIEAMLSIINED